MGSGGGGQTHPLTAFPHLLPNTSAVVAFPPELGKESSTPRPELPWKVLLVETRESSSSTSRLLGMQCHGEVSNNLQPGLREQLPPLWGFQGPQLLLSNRALSPRAGRSSEFMDWTSLGRSFTAASKVIFVSPCQLSNPRSECWRTDFVKETIVRICLK